VALATDGLGIVLISSELEEILGLAHRVLVMRRGRIVAELEGDEMTEPAILASAFGDQARAGAA
jgi:ABC-type sugar transport system ATPase subunit